jgi:hypothetical protein
MFWIEALQALHCLESSWRNNSRDFCLVPTGKLHHALAGGEGDPCVGQIKVAGRWVRHAQDGQQCAGWPHVALAGIARAGRWRDLELSRRTAVTVWSDAEQGVTGCDAVRPLT